MRIFGILQHIVFILASLLVYGETSQGQSRSKPTPLHQLDIKSQPEPTDWQRFHKLSDEERKALWDYYDRLGKKLSHWSWEWRLGWLRRCVTDATKYCDQILYAGLQDRALLVRAEAASRIGEKFAGTENPKAIEALARAFSDKRNFRHDEPLIVHERILYSLKLIGGSSAYTTGSRLAANHDRHAEYWQKVARRKDGHF